MFAEQLYKEVDEKKGSGITFEMRFTMLEIYNEVARDLLTPKQKKGGLKIRQHPKKGFYGQYQYQTIYMIMESQCVCVYEAFVYVCV